MLLGTQVLCSRFGSSLKEDSAAPLLKVSTWGGQHQSGFVLQVPEAPAGEAESHRKRLLAVVLQTLL